MFLKNCPYSNFLFRNLHLHFLNTALTAALRQARLFTSVTSFDVLKVKSRLHEFLHTIFIVPFKNCFRRSVNEWSKFKLKNRCVLISSINLFKLHSFFVLKFCHYLYIFKGCWAVQHRHNLKAATSTSEQKNAL